MQQLHAKLNNTIADLILTYAAHYNNVHFAEDGKASEIITDYSKLTDKYISGLYVAKTLGIETIYKDEINKTVSLIETGFLYRQLELHNIYYHLDGYWIKAEQTYQLPLLDLDVVETTK